MPDPSRPTPDQLAETVRYEIGVARGHKDGSSYPGIDEAHTALADLLALAKRGEQAEAALNMLQEAYDNASADRDEQVAAAEQAEKERDEAVDRRDFWHDDALSMGRKYSQAEAERDRLAAALERIGNQGLLAADQRVSRAYLIQIAREALNPGASDA